MDNVYLPRTFAIAVAFSLSACSAMEVAPGIADIVAAARKQMLARVGLEASNRKIKSAVADAKIEPRGLCNSLAEKGNYVCAVKVASIQPGKSQEETQDFVIKLSKGYDSDWKLAS